MNESSPPRAQWGDRWVATPRPLALALVAMASLVIALLWPVSAIARWLVIFPLWVAFGVYIIWLATKRWSRHSS